MPQHSAAAQPHDTVVGPIGAGDAVSDQARRSAVDGGVTLNTPSSESMPTNSSAGVTGGDRVAVRTARQVHRRQSRFAKAVQAAGRCRSRHCLRGLRGTRSHTDAVRPSTSEKASCDEPAATCGSSRRATSLTRWMPDADASPERAVAIDELAPQRFLARVAQRNPALPRRLAPSRNVHGARPRRWSVSHNVPSGASTKSTSPSLV